MKRTGWARQVLEGYLPKPDRVPPLPPPGWVESAKVAIKTIAAARSSMVRIGDLPHTAIEKENAVRSEPYRRLVAAYPCKLCGIHGFSQAAHVPPSGKGIKTDDRLTFPLCCARPGIVGCHTPFDQFKTFSKAVAIEIGTGWAADMRRQITAAGKWPKQLPLWSEA